MNTSPAIPPTSDTPAVAPLFLVTPGVTTYDGNVAMTNASSFFSRCDDRLHLLLRPHEV